MTETGKTKSKSLPRPKKRNLTPYFLLMPTLIYLALFFAWPMVRSLGLALYDEEAALTVHAQPDPDSDGVGLITRQTGASDVEIITAQGIPVDNASVDDAGIELWYEISASDVDEEPATGWIIDRRIRVNEDDSQIGTVRASRRSDADPFYPVYVNPGETTNPIANIPFNNEVAILDQTLVEIWYNIRETSDTNPVEGWVAARTIKPNDDLTEGFIDRPDTGQWTTKYIESMFNDRFFDDALITTIVLIVIIIPIQFVLAIIMALVIQARLKGNSLLLYIFTIPLGVSDLAVGIVFLAIFTQSGYLNSTLMGLGITDKQQLFLTADSRHWIFIAVILAEVWRATSIVMVIVVSGLQAVPEELLEAAQIFGAGSWQRLRHVILPLLKPSLQVALILRTILAFQVFAVVVALSGGDIVTTLANETFRQYGELRNNNVAAAYAGFILLLSMISAFFYLRAVRTQQEMAE